MTQMHFPPTKDVSRLLFFTIRDFYRSVLPEEALTQISQLHLSRWHALLSGKNADALHRDLLLVLNAHGFTASLAEDCDNEVTWTLTPEFAAFAACIPSDERVDLRTIRATLENLVQQTHVWQQDAPKRPNLAHAA